MNIVLLTMSRIVSISKRGIYTDLMRKFRDEGHRVYIIAPLERGKNSFFTVHGSQLMEIDGVTLLAVKTLNLQKTNVIEKGVGQIVIDRQFRQAIKRDLSSIRFDLILYSTPPITFSKAIKDLKHISPEAKSYLLLKDIFPQNAVDLGMMSKTGVSGIIYRYFLKKERALYTISDYIGCMSPANVAYLLDHNPSISNDKVEVAPNSVELHHYSYHTKRNETRKKYGLPLDRPLFIYGGNLGKPQGIPFLINCLSANASRQDCFFVVIGTGTELPKLKNWYENTKPHSVKVMDGLPKDEYDELVRSCDVGLIFLDHRFSIPNYPSRLLSYLENKMPVLCATDPNTDIGSIAEKNGYGFWCESNSVDAFNAIVEKMIHSDRLSMGEKGFAYLINNYLVDNTYNTIISHV